MQGFIVQTIIASVILTILLNAIPLLFPKSTQKAERHIHEKMEKAFAESEDGKRPKVQVFFPWKTMLLISVILTVVLNVISFI